MNLREGVKGSLGAENNISITGAIRATAMCDLYSFVEKGVLPRTGERKSMRCWSNIVYGKSR